VALGAHLEQGTEQQTMNGLDSGPMGCLHGQSRSGNLDRSGGCRGLSSRISISFRRVAACEPCFPHPVMEYPSHVLHEDPPIRTGIIEQSPPSVGMVRIPGSQSAAQGRGSRRRCRLFTLPGPHDTCLLRVNKGAPCGPFGPGHEFPLPTLRYRVSCPHAGTAPGPLTTSRFSACR
jgi:hypothetical protein